MDKTQTGIERLITDKNLQNILQGNLALLYHNASVTSTFTSTLEELYRLYPKRLIKLFGPQHGVVSDVQDNMVESGHSLHPHYQLPIFSLYSETRKPTRQMLEG